MARIAGINVPLNKTVNVALTYIHGIGLHSSNKICKKLMPLINVRVVPVSITSDFDLEKISSILGLIILLTIESSLKEPKSDTLREILIFWPVESTNDLDILSSSDILLW